MEHKIRINIIFPYNSVGGAFRSTYEIANRLKKLDYDVIVYFPFFPIMDEYKKISFSSIKYFLRGILRSLIRRNKIFWFDCNFDIKLIPFIDRKFIKDADFVIANHWLTAKPTYFLPRSKGKKFYFIRDIEQWAPYYEKEKEVFKLDMKRLVVADWIKVFLKNEFNLETEEVITNGFNFSNFSVSDKNFNKKLITISMIYSNHPMKDANSGVKVLKKIKKRFPDIKIILFGFERRPKNLGFDFEYIKGAAGEKVKEIYAQTDIFFCPSIQEGFHNPPSEAMAAKCAVLATSVGSVPYTIKNMENGIVVNSKDIDSMVQNMALLISDKSLRISLSEAGFLSIQSLTWDKSIQKLHNLFKKT